MPSEETPVSSEHEMQGTDENAEDPTRNTQPDEYRPEAPQEVAADAAPAAGHQFDVTFELRRTSRVEELTGDTLEPPDLTSAQPIGGGSINENILAWLSKAVIDECGL